MPLAGGMEESSANGQQKENAGAKSSKRKTQQKTKIEERSKGQMLMVTSSVLTNKKNTCHT